MNGGIAFSTMIINLDSSGSKKEREKGAEKEKKEGGRKNREEGGCRRKKEEE